MIDLDHPLAALEMQTSVLFVKDAVLLASRAGKEPPFGWARFWRDWARVEQAAGLGER